MLKPLNLLIVIIALVFAFYAFNSYIYNEKQGDTSRTSNTSNSNGSTNSQPEVEPSIEVTPISHASMVLNWDDTIIYTDPTGGPQAYTNQPEADIILVTDIHGDHYSPETLNAVLKDGSTLIAPQAVIDMMPDELADRTEPLANGEVTSSHEFSITAFPMYNWPETAEARHTKGRGNGYIIGRNGYRVYIAGDTGPTPEMRELKDIDMAFVPMNMPFTMSVEEAASAVMDFKPRVVYPYHYRGQGGLADVEKFKKSVEANTDNTEVILLNWYPEAE